MNPVTGCPTCDACGDDLMKDDGIDVVLHWDPDTDYNQLAMCINCANKYASESISVCLHGVWFERKEG